MHGGATSTAPAPTRIGRACVKLQRMWDVLEWHHGTLSVAWWVVLFLVFVLLGVASKAKRR